MADLYGKMHNLEPLFRPGNSHVMLLGDSKSSSFATERWPKSIFTQWDINWRGRVLPFGESGSIFSAGWGWAVTSLNGLSAYKSTGEILSDGSTPVPTLPRPIGEKYYPANQTTAWAYYDIILNSLDQCLRGSYFVNNGDGVNDLYKVSCHCLVGANNAITRFASVHDRASDYGDVGEMVTMSRERPTTLGGTENQLSIRFDLRHDLEDDTGKGFWPVWHKLETQSSGVLFDNLGYSGLAANRHYPAGWKANGSGWQDAERRAYYKFTGWPDIYLIELGTNGGIEDIETLIKYLANFHASNGKTAPKFGLIVTFDPSAQEATWQGLENTIADIVDRRDDCALINLRRWMIDNIGTYSEWEATYLADGIHQNAAGADLFGKATWEIIQQGIAASSLARSIETQEVIMAKKEIDFRAADNGLTGDPIGRALSNCQDNFTEIYAMLENALLDEGKLRLQNLPTSDPGVAGAIWNDSGTLRVSAG